MSPKSLLQSAFGPDAIQDLYSHVLNIPRDPAPTSAQIKKAYHKQALQYHPDKQIQLNLSTEEMEKSKLKFQAISFTYQLLSNEESRTEYDQTGYIPSEDDLDDDNTNKDGVQQWKDLFSRMFGKVTVSDIDRFEKKYKRSEEERQDVLKYYQICKGKFSKMLTCVMLSEEEDISRWIKDYINPAIAKNQIQKLHDDNKIKQTYLNISDSNSDTENDNSDDDADTDTVTESEGEEASDTKSNKKKIITPNKTQSKTKQAHKKATNAKVKAKAKAKTTSTTTTKSKKTKMSKKEKEAKEAEDLMAKLQQNALARRNGNSSFGSLLSSLESRYSNDKKRKKATTSKAEDDIPDDEFERIQAGLKKKQTKNSNRRR